MQEIVRFTRVHSPSLDARPLRYCALFDSHPSSRPYVARFHAKKVLKFRDALLTSYHKNEVLTTCTYVGVKLCSVCCTINLLIFISGQIYRINTGYF